MRWNDFFATGSPPTPNERAHFRYPELRVIYRATAVPPVKQRAYAKFQGPGVYATTITQPAFFRNYLLEQLNHLVRDYGATIEVGVSDQEIPYPYVFERGDELGRGAHSAAELAQHFPTPLLAKVGDEIADGTWELRRERAAAARRSSMRRGSIIRCAGSCTTPAPTGARSSPGSCSPTTTAMSTSSCAGRVERAGDAGQPVSAGWCCPAASSSSAALDGAAVDALIAAIAVAPLPDAGLSPHAQRRPRASRWSTSASARPTPRPSPTISRCCGRIAG